jgi:hypothetical protein
MKVPQKVFAAFLAGIDNTIRFFIRTAVTLNLRPQFSKAQQIKNGSERHG